MHPQKKPFIWALPPSWAGLSTDIKIYYSSTYLLIPNFRSSFPVIVTFPYCILGPFVTYKCLGPSCTVFYSAPANYHVVHLVIFYWYWYWYCMVLYCTALYCIVSYGILCYLIVSNSIAQYCTLLCCWLRRVGCVLQDAYILHKFFPVSSSDPTTIFKTILNDQRSL